MRRVVVAIACVAVTCACKPKTARPVPVDETMEGETATEEQEEDVPEKDPRIAALETEWNRYGDVVLTHSAKDLTDGEKQMMEHLLAAAALIEELHMLQLHPKNLDWWQDVQANGTEVEKNVYRRYQMPWCGDDESADCAAVANAPERRIGWYHWPDDLTDEEYGGLGDLENGKALLSPFTVVRRGEEEGTFEAIPYSQTDELGPRMKKVAGELRAAAEHAPDPSLKKFLESRAAAFEADDPYPYDASDYDWIALEGDWEVTVGPYETYKNPHQLKALFEMYVGKEDKELTQSLQKFKDHLQEMEDALGGLVGEDIYKSRKLDPRISIRVVDIWMASGDGRRDRGATVAFHLPNRGESVDEGLYKKVMMVNHSEAFEDVIAARAGLVLAEDQQGSLDIRADIKNVTFHEFAHGFGAYHEMEVTNPDGEKTTVKEALGEYDSLLEELKADTMGLWLLQFEKEKGWVTPEDEVVRYSSALMHILGLLQYPLSGTYPRMVAIQLGWYMDAGAVTWDAETGRFTVVYEKMPAAVESIVKKVATIQLTGDHAAAEELVGTYMEKKDDEWVLKGDLAKAREDMVGKFEEAGIKSPSLRYEVTDL